LFEKIKEKNEENSVIRVGYETFGGVTIRIPVTWEYYLKIVILLLPLR